MYSISAMASGEVHGAIVRIRHVGEEDKPIPTLVITEDATVAVSFREAVDTRVHLLDGKAFAKVVSFLAQESTKRIRSESVPGTLDDFGSFEVSVQTKSGTVNDFCFISKRRESLEIFKRFLHYLSEQNLDTSLLSDINVLIKRVE
jgi:hypothetical protein